MASEVAGEDVCSYFLFSSQEDAQDLDALTLAKSYFDLKEYDRAAYFLKGCCSQKAYFLYMYSRYLVRNVSCLHCNQLTACNVIKRKCVLFSFLFFLVRREKEG